MKTKASSALLTISFTILAASSCGPLGGASEPPPFLELSAASVTFDPGEDSHLVELSNTGGGVIPFTVVVSAESGGVTWLQAEPAGGTLEGGTGKALLLTVTNREALLPGTYSGQVSIEAQNVEGRSMLVSMTVGQPILETDPLDEFDYGTATSKRTLLVTNTGDGTLLYSVLLPGPWITSPEALQRALGAGRTDSLVLEVDRALVPWYGPGSDELVVTSNGLNDATHGPTAKLAVKVVTDANCGTDADCTLPGYFCDDADGDGACALRRDNGSDCQADKQCSSALCVEGICCNAACGGPCESCALAATKGTCSPVADGTTCDDGLVCTDGDACDGGACTGGPPLDCGAFDNPCGPGLCSESAGGCTSPSLDDHCVIDGACLDDGGWHPEVPCLRCLPAVASDDWSVIPDRCHVDGHCYEVGAEIGGPCTVCDPSAPDTATAAGDGTPCGDDGNLCTADHCVSGICEHPGLSGEACEDADPCTHTDLCTAEGACGGTAYICDDGLDCTTDACLGDGSCSVEVAEDACVIDGACVEGGASSPGSGECARCSPGDSQEVWTAQPDALPCDDGDPCTTDDACLEGLCLGEQKSCDDGADCSEDSCVAGDCVHEIAEETCLIEGICYDEGVGPPGSPCQACLPDLSETTWSGYNVGTPCDLPNAIAQCGEDGQCVLIECIDALHGDCNETSSDGCEAELWQDLMHCGGCDAPCTRPNAWTACAGGQCSFVACHDGYTSCDGEETTGCEAHTATDPLNCGECGQVCDTSNPAKVGVCEESTCALSACPPDQWNLDGDPSNGCECTEGGPELCNGVDDDCDGEVDEGFDLLTDLENCGGCGQVCDLPDAAGSDCVNGACLLTGCPPETYDLDGDPLNGCEHTLFVSDELWVDGFTGGGPDADGSQAHPFASIQEALDVATPSTRINVLEGGYAGGIVLDKVGLSLVGAGEEGVTLATPEYGTGILVTADDVTIAGLKLSGGSMGIHLQGDPQQVMQGGLVADVAIEQLIGQDGAGQDTAGILVEYADAVTISFASIQSMESGDGGNAQVGGDAVGVLAHQTTGTTIAGCQISNLLGGKGQPWCISALHHGNRAGGIAAGIQMSASVGYLLLGNHLQDVEGGKGSQQVGGDCTMPASIGGIGAGIHLSASPDGEITGTTAASIIGGLPGNWASPDAQQRGIGIYLEEDSLGTEVSLTNTMDGDRIVYRYGVVDEEITGLSLLQPSNPTNLGKIVVVQGTNVLVEGNTVANFRGQAGTSSEDCFNMPGGDSASIAGILLRDCAGGEIVDNSVTEISGGRGGHPCFKNGVCSEVGDSSGIEVDGCTDVLIQGNEVATIREGGLGHPGNCSCPSGVASAYRITLSTDVTVHNNIGRNIVENPSTQGTGPRSTCVFIDGTGTLTIDHLTCHDIGESTSAAHGIFLGPGQLSQVHLRNSIVSDVTGSGVKGLAGVPGMLMAWFSDLHDCAQGASADATLNSCIEEDPLFVLPDEGNLHLQSGSPAIDAGNPATGCNSEPVPNGCRVNMGAYGNTDEAASAPGAEHCSPCP